MDDSQLENLTTELSKALGGMIGASLNSNSTVSNTGADNAYEAATAPMSANWMANLANIES